MAITLGLRRTYEEDLEEGFAQITTRALVEELERREEEDVIVTTPDAIMVEFTCPYCGGVSQEDMGLFDDDAMLTYACDCGRDIVIDLEE